MRGWVKNKHHISQGLLFQQNLTIRETKNGISGLWTILVNLPLRIKNNNKRHHLIRHLLWFDTLCCIFQHGIDTLLFSFSFFFCSAAKMKLVLTCFKPLLLLLISLVWFLIKQFMIIDLFPYSNLCSHCIKLIQRLLFSYLYITRSHPVTGSHHEEIFNDQNKEWLTHRWKWYFANWEFWTPGFLGGLVIDF